MDTTETQLHTKTKENCFRLLSACFYEPQKELFMEENLFGNLKDSLDSVCPEASKIALDMEREFRSYSSEELRIEYAKLFTGPFELQAPPYGSVYLDEGRRVMGDSTMGVIAAYEKEGLAKNEDFKDLPDHIVVEMEFMSYLMYKEAEARGSDNDDIAREYADKQEYFFKTYILTWVPQFCSKIKEGTENRFYCSLADCLSVFVTDCQ